VGEEEGERKTYRPREADNRKKRGEKGKKKR